MVLLESRYDTLKHGDKAPSFALKSISGKLCFFDKVSGYQGYVIIFMCNHCPYVVPKIKTMIDLQKEFPQIKFIGINSNNNPEYPDDNFEHMQKYAAQWKLNFEYVIDETQEIAKNYGATCTPDPFLFDKNKKLVYHGRLDQFHGKEQGNGEDLRHAIKEMLAGRKVSDDEMYSMGCSIKWMK
ncbi:thioredoxin family protein [Candidatus Woesearchaeota archaeon]|nr:thioredoxin family protein [Candidatus Woesearchaeota archaeon]